MTSGKTLVYAAQASQSYLVRSDPHEVADFVFSGAVTSILTNPIWVVKIRMFTTHPNDPTAYRNLWRTSSFLIVRARRLINRVDGLSSIYRTEGVKGLYRGTVLALVGVSNGALQFMAYERIKLLAFKRKRRSFERTGKPWTTGDDKLVSLLMPAIDPSRIHSLPQSNTTYTIASGASKLFALTVTYPYQVVRARIQVRIQPTTFISSPTHLNLTSLSHRTTPQHTCIPTSPRASRERTPKEA